MTEKRDEEDRGFKVHDRRRFSDSGDPREPEESTATVSESATEKETAATASEAATGGETAATASEAATGRETAATASEAAIEGVSAAENAAAGRAYDDAQRVAAAGSGAAHGPEINFPTFVISLSTQALAHLGEIPDPTDGALRVELIGARQLIDILAMLKDKTRGNLDGDEAALLDHALYDLRMKYVERAHQR